MIDYECDADWKCTHWLTEQSIECSYFAHDVITLSMRSITNNDLLSLSDDLITTCYDYDASNKHDNEIKPSTRLMRRQQDDSIWRDIIFDAPCFKTRCIHSALALVRSVFHSHNRQLAPQFSRCTSLLCDVTVAGWQQRAVNQRCPNLCRRAAHAQSEAVSYVDPASVAVKHAAKPLAKTIKFYPLCL